MESFFPERAPFRIGLRDSKTPAIQSGMDQWYYAKGGQQTGPIGLEALRELIGNGTIDPATDLVWNPSMTDWVPASQIPVLVDAARSGRSPTSLKPSQPFAYPLSTGAIEEIIPGSEPIIPTACVKRSWDLTVKHIGPLLAVVAIYVAISVALSLVSGAIGTAMGIQQQAPVSTAPSFGQAAETTGPQLVYIILSNVISSLVSVFLMLGFIRIGLNIVSGKEFSVGMLFGEGGKVVRAFFAQILFGLMIGLGLLLLIFPGIYLALRYSQYMNAIVDKDMGIMDAFNYSASITTNNKANLFVIFLFTIGIIIAGCLAFIVGLIFAYPMIGVMWIVAYRWMQYGGRTVLDDPMTNQPLLSSVPE